MTDGGLRVISQAGRHRRVLAAPGSVSRPGAEDRTMGPSLGMSRDRVFPRRSVRNRAGGRDSLSESSRKHALAVAGVGYVSELKVEAGDIKENRSQIAYIRTHMPNDPTQALRVSVSPSR
jgi:hypothetical protein